ncbi:MAG TPA: hypothetical protein VIJ52_00565 [Pseudolabrys sp.]
MRQALREKRYPVINGGLAGSSLVLPEKPETAANTASDSVSYKTAFEDRPLVPEYHPYEPRKPKAMAGNDDLTDAKLRAIGAETDTKIARLEGKLDLVLQEVRASNTAVQMKLEDVKDSNERLHQEVKDSEKNIKNNSYIIAGVVVAIVVGFCAVVPFAFDLGSKNRESITNDVNARFNEFEKRITPLLQKQTPPTTNNLK